MTPEEFLNQLTPQSKVFECRLNYNFTEDQMLLFAKLYHQNEAKNPTFLGDHFSFQTGGKYKLEFNKDGKILVNGRIITSDIDLVNGFRTFVHYTSTN
jgi:hypothetical protein